jgi:diketogulonate reductase-like aldo/keto reductase
MIYGTAWKKNDTARLVALAIESGFRAIDTACQPKHYNEKQVGIGISNALDALGLTREDIFIQTKFTPVNGQDLNNIPYNPNDSLQKQICDSLEVSLANLQTSYIDSLILHSPIIPLEETMKAWSVFESFVEKGLVKQIGISNCYDLEILEYLYKHSKIKPKALQNRFYEHSGYDKELRAFCDTHNITYQSFWSLTANPHILNSKTLYEIALKHNKTPQQVFYRFLTQINITPLNGTTSQNHMKEDLSIGNFELNSKEIQSINELLL